MYAVKMNEDSSLSVRNIAFPYELLQDEMIYNGELILDSNHKIDMAFDPVVGLRLKGESERLADAKNLKIVELKASHESAMVKGFTTSLGITMDCSQAAVSNLTTFYTLYTRNRKATVIICDIDNKTHSLSLADFEKLVEEVCDHFRALYEKKWEKRTRVLDAVRIEDVEKVSFDNDRAGAGNDQKIGS